MGDGVVLDEMDVQTAAALLARCCGSRRWVERMLSSRPFGNRPALLAAATRIWRRLSKDDWLEAFAHHPRIGEAPKEEGPLAAWAKSEQSGALGAHQMVKERLARGNESYEAKFGYVYLVCAAGKSGAELLALLEARLRNDPATELAVAAGEQEKITLLRLEKLLES